MCFLDLQISKENILKIYPELEIQILDCLTAKYRQMKVGLFFQNQKDYLARKGSRIKVYFDTNSVLQIYVHNLSFIIETKKFTRLKIKVPFTINQKFTYLHIFIHILNI